LNWPAGDFTWTAAGAWGSFLMLCGVIARQVGPWRKQSIDAEKEFRDGLIARVEKLEKDLERERTDAKAADAIRQAELARMRHRLNNATQCLDAMLLMLEAAPEKATEIVVKIKDMRAGHHAAEALEAGQVQRTTIERAAE
jgi:outer membrane murein-binding lipoprotein Lpp